SASKPWKVLPSRAEVVARADGWAVRGATVKGAEGARWTQRAAELRARMWRLEGRAADGLEALELYAVAAEVAGPGRCDAALQRALLAGEIEGKPDQTYRDLYRLSRDKESRACGKKIAGALKLLSAYRPKPSVLAQLDKSSRPQAPASPSAVFSGARAEGPNKVIAPQDQLLATPTRVTQVERYGAKESARVVILLTQPTLFEVGVLDANADAPPRLYLDIQRASYSGKRSFEVGGLVEQVRLGQQATGTRVVLDLTEPAFHRVFYLPEPFRLIIDVSKTQPLEATQRGTGKKLVKRIV